MKIEIKKIKHYEKLSEETNCFTASLYIDGKCVAEVKNTGRGGETYIYPLTGKGEIVNEAHKYFQNQPKKKFEGSEYELQPTLDGYIDELLYQYLLNKDIEKQKKHLQKDMLKSLCYGKLESYYTCTWKGYDIEKLLSIPHGRITITNKIKELTKNGETILNTNIPKELYGI